MAILRAVGIVARRLGAGVMQYRMQAHYRRDVTRQYLRLPMSWHQQHPTGQLLSNANSDVEAAWAPIAPLPMAVGTVAMMVIAVAQMLFTDLVLAGVGLLVFPVVIAINVVYQRWQSPLMTRAQALRAEVSEVAHESFDGALVVKTLGRETEETERFARKARQLRDTNIKAGRIRAAFDPVLEALPSLGVLAVLAVGVIRVEQGLTDPGNVVTVAYLLTIVSFPIRSLGWLVGEFPRSVVGFNRVQSVLRATGEMAYGAEQIAPAGAGARLDVRGLSYRYADGPALLDDLTFTVEPGRTVAVVGATASGKSTMTSLLVRLVDPSAGQVLLDGHDLRDLAHGTLAEHVALVPQQAFLFDDTVRGNVTLGSDVPDDDVWQALRTAQADGFVAALPDGLDTRLGERGTTLSGGQRQRLSLARALVRRPRLLVMDDATSAVDPEVEARILAALRRPSDSHGQLTGGRRGRERGGGGLPEGDDLAGRRGGLPQGRARGRPGHALRAAGPQRRLRRPGQRLRARAGRRGRRRSRGRGERLVSSTGTSMDTGESISALRTIGRGIELSPELTDGIRGTMVFAVLSTIGRIVVPVCVQQTLDKGVNAPGGPDIGFTTWSC